MSARKDGQPRRKWGTKAIEAKRLAKEIVECDQVGLFAQSQAAQATLARLVGRGNVAYWVLSAEEEMA